MKINTTQLTKMPIQNPYHKTESHQAEVKQSRVSDVEALLIKHNRPTDAKTSAEINAFMSQASGSEQEKLETLEVALLKGVDLTQDNLNDLHQALKGEMTDLLLTVEAEQVVAEPLKSESLVQLIAQLKLPKAIKAQLVAMVEQGLSLKEALVRLLTQAGLSFEVSMDSSQLLKHLALALSLDQVSEPEKPVFVPAPKTDDLLYSEPSAPSKAPMAIEGKPQDQMDPPLEEEPLEEAFLEHLERAMGALAAQVQMTFEDIASHFDLKTYLVKETTEATIEAKSDFDRFQKQAVKALDFEAVKKPEDMAENLSKTIEQLNKLILKSNVTLFTDLYMERDLLKASAKLEAAKTHLFNRDFEAVKATVAEVKETLEKMTFEPSKIKVMAFATLRSEQAAASLFGPPKADQNLQSKVIESLLSIRAQDAPQGAKTVFETMRFMGLNHEVEVANRLDNRLTPKSVDWLQDNVKEILLRLMKTSIEERTLASGEKTLMDLSGQQLMNQSGEEQKKPFYYFNYPLVVNGELGEMKIYVNGNRKNDTIDMDHLTMYFGMDLKVTGQSGIKVTVTQGVLDIVVMSDRPLPLMETAEQILSGAEAIGFKKGQLRSEPFQVERPIMGQNLTTRSTPRKVNPPEAKKGFDFKI